MVTAANIREEMVGASMAVHLAGEPVIVTARNEFAGTVTSAALLTVGQGIMLTVCGSQEARMARTACALCQAVGTKTEPAI